MQGIYQEADIILNATPGSLDKVILEAMACGVIPIAHSKNLEAVLTPHSLYLKERDPQVLADKIEKVIISTDKEKTELREMSVNYVRKNHNVASLVNKILNV